MSKATAEWLLAEAVGMWKRGQIAYRETALAVGALIHQYILAGLREGDGLPEHKRLALEATRSALMTKARERMECSQNDLRRCIAGAMAVELLSVGGEIGSLSFTSINEFGVFLYRVGAGPQEKGHYREVSRCETWAIKQGFEETAPALFRRAVAEEWGCVVTYREVVKLTPPNVYPRRGRQIQSKRRLSATAIQDFTRDASGIRPTDDVDFETPGMTAKATLAAIAAGSPGDVANACLKLVLANEDPWQVAQRLIAELQRIPRKKPKSLLFEAGA